MSIITDYDRDTIYKDSKVRIIQKDHPCFGIETRCIETDITNDGVPLYALRFDNGATLWKRDSLELINFFTNPCWKEYQELTDSEKEQFFKYNLSWVNKAFSSGIKMEMDNQLKAIGNVLFSDFSNLNLNYIFKVIFPEHHHDSYKLNNYTDENHYDIFFINESSVPKELLKMSGQEYREWSDKKIKEIEQTLPDLKVAEIALERLKKSICKFENVMTFLTVFCNVATEILYDEYYKFKHIPEFRDLILTHGTAYLIKRYKFGKKGLQIQDDWQPVCND